MSVFCCAGDSAGVHTLCIYVFFGCRCYVLMFMFILWMYACVTVCMHYRLRNDLLVQPTSSICISFASIARAQLFRPIQGQFARCLRHSRRLATAAHTHTHTHTHTYTHTHTRTHIHTHIHTHLLIHPDFRTCTPK